VQPEAIVDAILDLALEVGIPLSRPGAPLSNGSRQVASGVS
jgi:hypothetical protein